MDEAQATDCWFKTGGIGIPRCHPRGIPIAQRPHGVTLLAGVTRRAEARRKTRNATSRHFTGSSPAQPEDSSILRIEMGPTRGTQKLNVLEFIF